MESFGRYLAQQRELRGLTVRDVAGETKLSPAAIQALEGDRFEELPARVFVVGYLRAYARCVGLGPDELVARFDEWRKATGRHALDPESAVAPPVARPPKGPPWTLLAGVGLPAVAAIVWWLLG